jgi:hypothetical protein
MPLIQLIYVSAFGACIRTPEGIVKAYEPFWATPDYVVRFKRARRRLFTVEEYGERILGSTLDALRQEAKRRKLSDRGTREQLIKRLVIKPLPTPENPWAVASTMELRLECIARGLPSEGGRAQLFESLSVKDGIHPGPIRADGNGGEFPADAEEAEEELVEDDAPTVDPEALKALKAALDKEDYTGVFSAIAAITDERPSTKAKADVFAFGRSLLA